MALVQKNKKGLLELEVNKRLLGDISDKYLESHVECGCCGAGTLVDARLEYIPELNIRFVKCPKCDAVSYNRIATQEYLDKMYTNYKDAYNWYNNDQNEAVTFSEPDRMAKHIYKAIEDELLPKDEIKILDFGGGSGVMGYKLAKVLYSNNMCKKIRVVVVDYLDKLYPSDSRDIVMDRAFPIQDINEDHFDVVIASAIIEHLPKPKIEMTKLFSVMAEGGYLYCRMPYGLPLFRLTKIFGVDFDMLYPGHIWDFSPQWYNKIIQYVGDPQQIKLIHSQPSIPETTFKQHFSRALITYLLKLPWYICHSWPFVGGWEAIYKKI